jgi:hypothetical protein
MSCLHPHLACATKELHVHAPAMHHPNVRDHSSMLRFTGKHSQASCAPAHQSTGGVHYLAPHQRCCSHVPSAADGHASGQLLPSCQHLPCQTSGSRNRHLRRPNRPHACCITLPAACCRGGQQGASQWASAQPLRHLSTYHRNLKTFSVQQAAAAAPGTRPSAPAAALPPCSPAQ